jgi:hypothetical protein
VLSGEGVGALDGVALGEIDACTVGTPDGTGDAVAKAAGTGVTGVCERTSTRTSVVVTSAAMR